DVVIPDLPRPLRQAANLGEPAIITSSVFRRAVIEIARQVASLALLDPVAIEGIPAPDRKRRWFSPSRSTPRPAPHPTGHKAA
ncbi:MAG: hypothetical protein ACREFY_19845, partial [Acetobacteraceae bacterium]